VLGVSPALGRGFTEEQAAPGNDLVILLSHRLWTARFGARTDVVGQSLRLDDNVFRIVGVMPEGFGFPDRDTDAWVPFAYSFAQAADDQSFESYVHGIGRLRRAATLAGLNAELDAIARRTIKGPRPAAFLEATGYTIRGEPLRDYVIGDLAQRLVVLQALVLAVLLIACANVANLQLTRLTARRKEFAVRAALGADTRRLARLLVLESVLLALAGACGGLLLAYGGIDAVRALGLERAKEGFELRLDTVVLVVTVSAALLAALLSVLVPLYELVREDFASAVQESGASTGGRATRRWRSALVVVQLAVGVTLLVAAGALTKTFYRLETQGPGFEPAGLWSTSVELPRTRYDEDAVRTLFFEQALAELRSLPGVTAAGFATTLPFTYTDYSATVVVDGQKPLDASVPQVAQLHSIDEGYFPALRVPVVMGRNFVGSESERVAIVDESFVRAYWPDGNALGGRLRNSADGSKDWYTIVGVVPHVKHDTFTHDEFEPTVYWHYLQRPAPPLTGMFVLRSALPTGSLTSVAQAAIARVDPAVALRDIVPMDTRVWDALGPQRVPMVLTLAFAAIAVALAVIGVYGVLAWAVARRVGEIGVRMALGAQTADVLRMVMKQGVHMIVAGLVLGIAGAIAVGRVLAARIPEVGNFDPVVLSFAVLALTCAALFACWLPARRATRIDPIHALRED
jgi:putative ABC transport system permease protein